MSKSVREQRTERKARAAATRFRRRPEMERLQKMKRANPEAFDRVSATTKIELGYYLNDKRAARDAGVDTSGDAA
jgi:hypothetical protein